MLCSRQRVSTSHAEPKTIIERQTQRGGSAAASDPPSALHPHLAQMVPHGAYLVKAQDLVMLADPVAMRVRRADVDEHEDGGCGLLQELTQPAADARVWGMLLHASSGGWRRHPCGWLTWLLPFL